jgi:DNA-binding CsgD family transcriptional regulator/tetratricopeptide (TPR) repeat protein
MASPLFVGRAGEIERLEQALDRAVHDRSGAVLITGEAGVGKTRLVAEFGARVEPPIRVLVGSCIDLDTGDLPYAPFVDVLHGLAHVVDPRSLAAMAGPGALQLANLVSDFAADDRMADARGSGLIVSSKARIFEAVLSLLERVAAEHSLVIVLEDIHWADRSTRELLAFLVRSLRRPGVLLVATVRTDGLGRDNPVAAFVAELGRHERVERIDLSGLGPLETARQVAAIQGSMPEPSVLDRIVTQSDGNPFVVEELLAGGLAEGEVPPTLRQIVLFRVAERSERAQDVLRALAVGGHAVDHELLATVADGDEAELSRALRELVDYDLLVVNRDDGDYRFRHVLVRDAVYADVLPGERRRLHRRYAEELTRLGSSPRERDAVAARVAHHWDRGGEGGRAFLGYIEAASAAERVAAHPEALEHYRRAMALRATATGVPAEPDDTELLARAAEAAYPAGEFDQAVDLALRAQARIDPVTDPVGAAVAGERSSRAMWAAGDERAVPTLAAAVALLHGQPPSRESAAVLAAQARMLMLHSDQSKAEAVSLEAIEIARATGAILEEARATITLAIARGARGFVEEALGLVRQGIELAERVRDIDEVARGYLNLHWILSSVGRLREALAAADEGTRMAARLGTEWAWGGVLFANRAETLLLLGRWDEAAELIEAVLTRDLQGMIELDVRGARAHLLIGRGDFRAAARDTRRLGELAMLSDAERLVLHRALLAELAVWEGRWEDGREMAKAAVATVLPDDAHVYLPQVAADGLRAEAELSALARIRRDEAELTASRAIADDLIRRVRALGTSTPGLDSTSDPRFVAHVARAEAEYSRVVDPGRAEAWQATVDAFERLEMPFESAYARYHLAEALVSGKEGDRARARGVLQRAYRTVVALQAEALQRDIEQLALRARIDVSAGDAESGAGDASGVEAPRGTELRDLGLTAREIEVLRLLAGGRTNRQIASALFITERTAALHVSNILGKLGVSNRLEAAAVAHRVLSADASEAS